MMVESFISTQKYSVHRELRRQFRRYLAPKTDLFPMLLAQLQARAQQLVMPSVCVRPS
jgi:hypothetical protein